MSKLEECTWTVGELFYMAYQKNPIRTHELKECWENTDMTNREYITGL